ncbi:hypothetical protein PHYPSEUDO_007324 [Phytophthora pseudosyringae]|uniref:Uncharacterized protein n=1 Tax=Phytophthora pseudosyringae TaxID=221518 RepID=A0A8T1VGD5_9STRA|nr:hypothetical protein PHYPSEUDO_007324 [Phytophthora pseudosyringae]
MERYAGDVCACLKGDVYITPRQVARPESNNKSVPVPWIAVIFRADNPHHSKAQLLSCLPTFNHHHNNTNNKPNTPGNASSGPVASYGPLMRQAHDKLVAIRFLSLVARCPEYSWRGNPHFWRHVLNDVCGSPPCDGYFSLPRQPPLWDPSCAPARDSGEVQEMPKFQLIFSSTKIKNELLELCAQAFSSPPNEIFQRAEQRVQDVLTRLEVAIPRQPRTVKIDLNFSCSRLRVADCMTGMQTLLGAALSRSEITTGLHSSKVLFVIRCLDLSKTTISERDLAPLAAIMTLPALAVSKLKLDWVFTTKTSKRFMSSFCVFVAASFAISLTEAAATTSLRKLCLNSSPLSAFQLAALFSAIHRGGSRRGVRELSLRGFEGSNSWLWLAFGVFHPESKSPIERLDLSHCVLRLEDVEIVHTLLESADYSPFLMAKKNIPEAAHNPRSQPSHWVLLPADTCLEIPRDIKKHYIGRPAPALKLQTELWCEVLDSGVSWSCVLVPAYGKLYVKNSKIIKTESRPRSTRNSKLKTLRMVAVKTAPHVLQVGDDGVLRGSLSAQPDARVLSEWVKVIGQSLETLHLCSNPFRPSTLVAVLEACPLLLDLDVSGCGLTDIGPITRAFGRERCNLRTLKAAQNHISAVSQQGLFQLLGDSECVSIRHLLVLHLEDNPTSRENRILNVLRTSLRRNRTLRSLVLTMDDKHMLSQNLRYRLDRNHQDEWLGHEDLPFQNRLALLSVSMVKALPTAVIEIILDFARRDVYRQVFWA